jgi:hypothetical protein
MQNHAMAPFSPKAILNVAWGNAPGIGCSGSDRTRHSANDHRIGISILFLTADENSYSLKQNKTDR